MSARKRFEDDEVDWGDTEQVPQDYAPSQRPRRPGPAPMEWNAEDADRAQVMAAMGIRRDQAAKVLGMSANTMRKLYADELELGTAEANETVAQSLFRKATGNGPGSVTAAIFWLKCRGGWREVNTLEVTGESGLVFNFVDAPPRADDDEPHTIEHDETPNPDTE